MAEVARCRVTGGGLDQVRTAGRAGRHGTGRSVGSPNEAGPGV